MQRNLEAELSPAGSLGPEFELSKIEVTPCDGSASSVDLSWFRQKGININLSQCFDVAEVPVGSRAYAAACAEKRLQKAEALMKARCHAPAARRLFHS